MLSSTEGPGGGGVNLMMDEENILEVRDISKAFSGIQALDNISFTVRSIDPPVGIEDQSFH